jgi:RNA polymerase sigma-70 factor (ECF subfamily)
MLSNQSYHIPETVMDDERKIIEASKKNPERFGVLYERYYEKIFRFIYRRVEDKEKAFDITSQVFLNALVNIRSYEDKGVPFVSWLYRIAYNETMKACKQNDKLRAVHVKSEDFIDILQDMQEENKEEYYTRIAQAMEGLNEEELQLIEMRYFENRPFKEIGEIAGITENNAKVKLYRVIEKLKKNINPKSL